ncbi:MAG: hypothetical protein Q8M92_06620 [Candidatus Subteraquimicrobiales bacterium]|nr:hypothetical protein [Candidatus Subteraquimicrobiales bacterium]
MNKSTPWLLLVIAILVIALVVLAYHKNPEPVVNTITEIDTLVVSNTVRTQLNREQVITVYDTVYVNNEPYTVARYRDRIDTTKVSVQLDIAYWEYTRKFDVGVIIDADIDTVYITKTITNNITTEKPYKTFTLFSGISPMFKHKDGDIAVNSVGMDVGVRLKGKYDIGLMGATDETFGVRFGVAF